MKVTIFDRLNAAACDHRLSHAHFRLFYAITQRKTTGLKSQPSIAKYLAMNKDRVKDMIDDLVDYGLLTVKEGRGRGHSNEYAFPEKGVYATPFNMGKGGPDDPLLETVKGGEIDQIKGGKIDPEKGVKSTPSLKEESYKGKEHHQERAHARDDGWRWRDELSEVEQKIRREEREFSLGRTANMTAAEVAEAEKGYFAMFIDPWRKNKRLPNDAYWLAKRCFDKIRASGAACLGEILIQGKYPTKLPDPMPDPIDWLRSFDRDRGANGQDMRPGNTATDPPDHGANGHVTQQKGERL